ncbi:MAG: prepilin-type N-terminal cleavage/methylation domain-containing protein [bacterium]|nr:prepilin-type N-terminal cleavage/methylation domain-containing protein [bacterium]
MLKVIRVINLRCKAFSIFKRVPVREKKSLAGFTLLEVLIAVAVTGIALIAIIDIFNSASRAGRQAENLSIALNLAQQRMEDVKNLVLTGTKISVGTGSNSGDSFLPDLNDVNTDNFFSGNLHLTESNSYSSAAVSLSKMNPPRRVDRITQVSWAEGINTYKKVQVTVFWQEKGVINSCGLATLIRE